MRAGGRPTGTGEHLRYLGVVLAPPAGSRATSRPDVVGMAAAALRDAGLITDEQAIGAVLDLTRED